MSPRGLSTRGLLGSRCSTGGTLPAFTMSATIGDSANFVGAAAAGDAWAAGVAVACKTESVGAAPLALAVVGAAAAGVERPVVVVLADFVAVGAVVPPPQAVTAAAAATEADSLRKCRRF